MFFWKKLGKNFKKQKTEGDFLGDKLLTICKAQNVTILRTTATMFLLASLADYLYPPLLNLWRQAVLVRFYCLNCTNFGQLIMSKIIKTVATKCHILRLKCTKFDFSPRPY